MPEAPVYRTTADLYRMLRSRYEPQAWSLMFEVADATGARQRRWADAVAMSLWPSRGLGLHGHEVKASRSDWLRELKKPEKAESICRFCDHWWLVVSDKCIVHDGELPPTWGLLAPDGRGVLKTIVDAPRLEAATPDRMFLAALLRAASKPTVDLDRTRLSEEYSRGYKEGQESGARTSKRLQQDFDQLQADVRDFESAAGFGIRSGWNNKADKIGRVVKEVLAGKYDRDAHELDRIRRIAADIVERIDASGLSRQEAA